MAIASAGRVWGQTGRERVREPGVWGLKTGKDSVQRVCVPHLGIPSLEPASEGGGFRSLFDGGDGSPFATAGVRVHVLFCCTKRRTRSGCV